MTVQGSLEAEIVSAKSSEMNVMIPVGEDFVEQVKLVCLKVRGSVVLRNFAYPDSRVGTVPLIEQMRKQTQQKLLFSPIFWP